MAIIVFLYDLVCEWGVIGSFYVLSRIGFIIFTRVIIIAFYQVYWINYISIEINFDQRNLIKSFKKYL